MADSAQDLGSQLRNIWARLNGVQRIILVSTVVVTIAGLVAITSMSPFGFTGGYSTLYVNLESEDAGSITEAIKDMKVPYKFDNGGRSLMVPKGQLYEVRMQMARLGLPAQGGQGYELFDKLQLGMTDFVQNLNYRRALEGELARTIESLNEVERARVHVTIPKPTLFTERKEEATASVILKLRAGAAMSDKQVRGIAHLMASSVEGLRARQVTILDMHGQMLSRGFSDDPVAEMTDHNLSIQNSVESNLERKIQDIFEGLLGPNKSRIKVAVELDFDRVQKTVETFDPANKVVRSQQREDGMVKNAPSAELEQKEGTITNYEIDKTVAQIISTPGTRRRVTVSMAVDGTYTKPETGDAPTFVPRSTEELDKFTALVKNTVGFNPGSKDEVFVTCVQFDTRFLEDEKVEMMKLEKQETYKQWGKYGVIAAICIFGFIFLRGLIRMLSSLLRSIPSPRYAGLDLGAMETAVPENVQRQKDIIERAENMTRSEPVNIANLIKTWIQEDKQSENNKRKKKLSLSKD